jgi:hypothetical protein
MAFRIRLTFRSKAVADDQPMEQIKCKSLGCDITYEQHNDVCYKRHRFQFLFSAIKRNFKQKEGKKQR